MNVLRIMLAAHLAIWTPAWCCCMIKAAVGVGAPGCTGEGCCSQRVATTPATGSASCCVKSGQEECCEGDGDPVASSPIDTPSSCTCHNELNDVVRLDTGSRVSVPMLSVDMHAALLVGHRPISGVDMELGCRDAAVSQRAHPPPATLLEQHCQLII
jgi:hypothetical protein